MSTSAPIWGVKDRVRKTEETPVKAAPAPQASQPVEEVVPSEQPKRQRSGHARGFSTVRISKNLAQATRIAAEYMGITSQALLERVIRDAVKPICLEALQKARPYNPFEEEDEVGEEADPF